MNAATRWATVRRMVLGFVLLSMWLRAHFELSNICAQFHIAALPLPTFPTPCWPSWSLALSGAATLACLGIFVWRGRAVAGLLACAFIWVAELTLTAHSDDVNKIEGMPAAAALAYLAVHAIARSRITAEKEASAAACAVIGAAYTVSGISKLFHGGLGWANSHSLQVLIATKTLDSPGPLREYLAHSPNLLLVGSGAVLLIELSGAAMMFTRVRPYYAAIVIGMHLGIYLGLGIMFWNWMLIVMLFGLMPRGRQP